MKTIDVDRIDGDNFRPYGVVASLGDVPPLAENGQFRFWSDLASYTVEGETEIGYCTVRRPTGDVVDWMEAHERTPEVLVPIDWPFILPVMDQDGAVAAFEVQPGEAVVIKQGVWHSACIPVGRSEASYLVLFRRRTPHDDVSKRTIDEVTIRRADA